MTIGEIHDLVSGGESETIEFKRTTGQRTDGARTLCGMLNGMGGFVLFGVEDDGRVRGQEVTAKTMADLVDATLLGVRDNLQALRRLDLVQVAGRGRGAR